MSPFATDKPLNISLQHTILPKFGIVGDVGLPFTFQFTLEFSGSLNGSALLYSISSVCFPTSDFVHVHHFLVNQYSGIHPQFV